MRSITGLKAKNHKSLLHWKEVYTLTIPLGVSGKMGIFNI